VPVRERNCGVAAEDHNARASENVVETGLEVAAELECLAFFDRQNGSRLHIKHDVRGHSYIVRNNMCAR
jgi:hypothetical protein